MSSEFHRILGEYKELAVRYDQDQEALWCYFRTSGRPRFSPQLLQESKRVQQSIIDYFKSGKVEKKYPIRYIVLASQTPGVFNLGGDLDLFIKLIKKKDRDGLFAYASDCIDICYMNAVALNLPLTTISLVQGAALGGGFELAMSSNVLIAEEQSQMGVPEIRFNLFPGMGAFSFISRKANMRFAEQVLNSGKLYSAREMLQSGIVDIVPERGQGYQAVGEYIKKHRRLSNGLLAIQAVKRFYNPVTYEELISISKIWVDTALRLRERDFHVMERLRNTLSRGRNDSSPNRTRLRIVRSRQDRRIESQDLGFPLVDHSGSVVHQDRRKSQRRKITSVRMAS